MNNKLKNELHEKRLSIAARNAELQNNISKLLTDRTDFSWNLAPQDRWANFSKESLMSLVQQIAIDIGITNEQAKIFRILFADNMTAFGKKYLAVTVPEFSPAGYVLKCAVVFNRSRVVLENQTNIQTNQPIVDESEYLWCVLEDPYEWFIWIITEELYHAKLFCMAGSSAMHFARDKRFAGILKQKQRESKIVYENDYQEMTVARICLRILAKYIPQRSRYFANLYEISLSKGKRAFPQIGKIRDLVLI